MPMTLCTKNKHTGQPLWEYIDCGVCCVTRMYHKDNSNVEVQYVPKFYSVEHAQRAGWSMQSGPNFCPSNLSYVWVCPECTKEKNENNQD